MGSFDEEEKERQKLESRIESFKESRRDKGAFGAWRGLSLVGSLGFMVAVSLISGLMLGVYLDRRFGTKPWLTLTGLVLGLAAAGKSSYELIRSAIEKRD